MCLTSTELDGERAVFLSEIETSGVARLLALFFSHERTIYPLRIP
jgi:hypothetical protein